MKYLWPEWPRLSQKLKTARHRLYLFDVDGTLSPIVNNPSHARVDIRFRSKLRQLSSRRGASVGILSGRSLAMAQKMIRVPGLIYGGHHCLEIKGAGLAFVHPAAKHKKTLIENANSFLQACLRGVQGLVFENKGFSLSVHSRKLGENAQSRFRKTFIEFAKTKDFMTGLSVREGKRVFEILPKTNWNKGSALKVIRKRMPAKPMVLFAGDDHTDEDAFAALGKSDISIQIGFNPRSRACYYLKSQREVGRLLTELCKI